MDVSLSWGDNHLCKVKARGTVHIKIFDGMVQELKDVSMYLN